MNDLGVLNCFLSIQFTINNGTISMDQSRYLENKLVKYQLYSCKSCTNPCVLADYELKGEDGGVVVDNRLYREMVGSSIYAMTSSCPDLSRAVSILLRKFTNPLC